MRVSGRDNARHSALLLPLLLTVAVVVQDESRSCRLEKRRIGRAMIVAAVERGANMWIVDILRLVVIGEQWL